MENRILEFTVENSLSFKTRQTVDFSKDHVACFVGHNGSGKTNLLLEIEDLADFYLNMDGEKRQVNPGFDDQEGCSSFSIRFLADGESFIYTIEVLAENDTLKKEELRTSDGKLVLNMELSSTIGNLTEIERERIATYPTEDIGIFHLLYSGKVKIQDSAINESINKCGRFFESIIFMGISGKPRDGFDYGKELYENPATKAKVLDFMKRLDYDIDDIVVEKITQKPFLTDSELSEMGSGIENEDLKDFLRALNKFSRTVPESLQKQTQYSIKYVKRPDLKNPMDLRLESDGVRRLIGLLPWIFANESKIILVDELERGFHEVLVMELLREVNNNVNQFLFTSHLLELMTRNCLNKNQLFSVVKEKGQSVVYPLSQYSDIRDDRHSLKNLYRAGKIPGYPYIAD